MNATSREAINPKTGLTLEQMKDFIRNHFEQFVNQKNLDIADVNFATEFIDHGADVPPGTAPGPAGAKQYVGGAYKRFPDIHVQIEDLIAEDDRVVVRNHGPARMPRRNIKGRPFWSRVLSVRLKPLQRGTPL